MNLTWKESKIASDVTAPLPVTRGIERTFSRPFSETFRISKNEDFSGPYLENENEFLKNSFETVFRASKSCDRDQLVSAFQLTFKVLIPIGVRILPRVNFSFGKLRLFTLTGILHWTCNGRLITGVSPNPNFVTLFLHWRTDVIYHSRVVDALIKNIR